MIVCDAVIRSGFDGFLVSVAVDAPGVDDEGGVLCHQFVVDGVVVRDELAVGLAAREGARAAAVAANPGGAATAAATRAIKLPIAVSTSVGARTVTVTVTYTDSGGGSLITRLLGSVTHRASATMALEPP